MKNILIVSTSYPNSRNTAAGIFVQNFAKALSESPSCSSVEVLAPSVAGNKPVNQPVPVHFFRYTLSRFETIAQLPGGIPAALKANPFMLLMVPFFVTSMFLSILKRSRHCNLILAQWSLSGLIAGLAKKGTFLVTTFHGEDIRRALGRGPGSMIALWAIKLSDYVICVSDESLVTLKNRFPKQSDKMMFISNGVDSKLYDIKRTEKDRPVVKGLMVNSLTNHKSTAHVLEALEKLKGSLGQKVVINVVGDGPEKPLLEDQVKQKNLEDNVCLLGVLDQQDVFRLYEESDFFLICSKGEGRSSVVMEAMASGLPVIASDVVGIRELLNGIPDGFLYNYGDCDQLAQNMRKIVESSHLRFESGLGNRERVYAKGLNWEKCGKRYLSLNES